MVEIDRVTDDELINLALDTLNLGKQLLIFTATKKGAEASAEKISKKLGFIQEKDLSQKILKAISTPTKQCLRLSKTLEKGVAFHHSGLNSKQREVVEESFREGKIKIICCTTTLGAGLDLPAFRVIIRDMKRFSGGWGSTYIPVLEYEQMSGRAGRPSFDTFGEAICLANDSEEFEYLWEEYINGVPEDITSKLAVEPVLRMHILSLIASGYVKKFDELKDFFKNTFYASQFKDDFKLVLLLETVLRDLKEWKFIESSKNSKSKDSKNLFVNANDLKDIGAGEDNFLITMLGKRVSELYLDPETAHIFDDSLQQIKDHSKDKGFTFMILHLLCSCNELRPLFRMKKNEQELVDQKLSEVSLLEKDFFLEDYEAFLNSVKTAIVLEDWMNEITEDVLLERYGVTPGEFAGKLERADWLLYSCQEIAKLKNMIGVPGVLSRIRVRLKQGIREELLPLVKLKGIGRVRARKLFDNKIQDLKDIKKTDTSILAELLGVNIAVDVKRQIGEVVDPEKIIIKKNKRKGQKNLDDY